MTPDDLKRRIDAIEDGYEFFLAYAAQGLTDDSASNAGEQVRSYLHGFQAALDGLPEAFQSRLQEGVAGGAAASAAHGDAGGAQAVRRRRPRMATLAAHPTRSRPPWPCSAATPTPPGRWCASSPPSPPSRPS